MYFPLILDGGPKTNQFQATLTFVNTSLVTATVDVFLYATDGSAWKLDFGSGATSTFELSIPSGGSRALTSRSGSTTAGGWAIAFSNAAVQGVVSIRELGSGNTFQQFMIQPVLPTLDYTWPGDKNSLISLANVYGVDPVSVQISVLDSEGKGLGSAVKFTLGPNQQTLFRVGDKFPNADKTGTIIVSAVDRPHDIFVAYSLAGDGTGVYSGLPNGGASWPISHWDRIWSVFYQVTNAAVSFGVLSSVPELRILGGQDVNAFAKGGTTVSVTLGLSQLISDSPSELGFAIAHELGHIYQQRTGHLDFDPNPEFDADIWGSLISITASYDPYAAAGTLAKLSMATGDAGLASQFEDQLASDAHKSFNSRLDNIFAALVFVCSRDEIKQACAAYKSIAHPNLPTIAPLVRHGPGR